MNFHQEGGGTQSDQYVQLMKNIHYSKQNTNGGMEWKF